MNKWDTVLKIAKKFNNMSVVCSKHFISSEFKTSTKGNIIDYYTYNCIFYIHCKYSIINANMYF